MLPVSAKSQSFPPKQPRNNPFSFWRGKQVTSCAGHRTG